MRTVGQRKEAPITFSASDELLAEGARFNDDIHRLPTGDRSFVRKGIYRFKSLDDANHHDQDCIVAGMLRAALDRDQCKKIVAPPPSKTSKR